MGISQSVETWIEQRGERVNSLSLLGLKHASSSSFFICASGSWALDWNLHHEFPWFLGFWIQAKLCHWLFCFSGLLKVDDGTLWPWWLHETIPIINLYLSVCVYVCVLSCSDSFVTLWTAAHQAPLSMGVSSKNTEVGCHALLMGIFLTQGSNPSLLHWQADSLLLSHLESHPSIYLWIYLSMYHVSIFLSYWLQFFEEPWLRHLLITNLVSSTHNHFSLSWPL